MAVYIGLHTCLYPHTYTALLSIKHVQRLGFIIWRRHMQIELLFELFSLYKCSVYSVIINITVKTQPLACDMLRGDYLPLQDRYML